MIHSKQETFDTVAKHLLTQGKRAISGAFCAYRGEDGRKCAVGCLIPDDKYNAEFEGNVIELHPRAIKEASERSYRVTALMKDLGYDLKFLRDIQLVHDNAPETGYHDYLRGALFQVAKSHDLNTEILNAF